MPMNVFATATGWDNITPSNQNKITHFLSTYSETAAANPTILNYSLTNNKDNIYLATVEKGSDGKTYSIRLFSGDGTSNWVAFGTALNSNTTDRPESISVTVDTNGTDIYVAWQQNYKINIVKVSKNSGCL